MLGDFSSESGAFGVVVGGLAGMGVLVGNLSSGGSTDFLEAAEPDLFLRLGVAGLGVGFGAFLKLYLGVPAIVCPLGSTDFLVGLVVHCNGNSGGQCCHRSFFPSVPFLFQRG